MTIEERKTAIENLLASRDPATISHDIKSQLEFYKTSENPSGEENKDKTFTEKNNSQDGTDESSKNPTPIKKGLAIPLTFDKMFRFEVMEPNLVDDFIDPQVIDEE